VVASRGRDGTSSDDEKARRRALKASFKADERRAARELLPLTREQLEALFGELDRQLAGSSCDRTLRFTRAWADAVGVDFAALEPGLRDSGGYCDCEVFNLDPDAIFD
jgi:glycerophosphoryl diester phosphodiesterase